MGNVILLASCALFSVFLVIDSMEAAQEEMDKVIEDEITQKLSEDLLQSIEKKFQVDLDRSVDMVLVKIKMLLQNGTIHIQDKLTELQGMLDVINQHGEKKVGDCLTKKQNETTALAEKALHQMVVCGYALIGHDPAQAVRSVIALKNMIKQRLKPINEQKIEVYGLLKVCGHDHESLKKVIKCVISKSPLIKTAMMDVTGKLIEGVVDLTKLMAHGAMHEACLIEVIKTVEDEAFQLVKEVKNCAYGDNSLTVVENYVKENNATIIDVSKKEKINEGKADVNNKDIEDMKDLIRRMLSDNKGQELEKKFKQKLLKMQIDLGSVDGNALTSNTFKNDK